MRLPLRTSPRPRHLFEPKRPAQCREIVGTLFRIRSLQDERKTSQLLSFQQIPNGTQLFRLLARQAQGARTGGMDL